MAKIKLVLLTLMSQTCFNREEHQRSRYCK